MPVPAPIDVWRSANLLIQQYGDEAVFIAAQRADAFLAQGDFDGQRVWKSIVRAIIDLRRTKRAGDQLN